MTKKSVIKKCFYPPHCTWLNNSLSDFEADAAQTVSSSASDCVTTISSPPSFSPPHWSSSAAVWLLTITLQHLSSLSDVSPLSRMHNNVPTHAGFFFYFAGMARSPRSVTSWGRGFASWMTITAWREHDNAGHQTARKVRGMQLLFQSLRQTFSRS